MALLLLTDEQISYVVAEQVKARRPDIAITSVRAWHGGAFTGKTDASLLRAAAEEGLTLVTYDQKTIPPVLTEWGFLGQEHAGVVFVDELSIAQSDIGGLVLALIAFWDQTWEWEWKNVISFLRPVR
jgi:hypothetical protein